MPGLVQRCATQPDNAAVFSPPPGSALAHGVWSKQRDDVSLDQLQKFWNELTPQARHELLRIDKHTLFEQARKNLYCSRCNGLLLEGFSQIVMYGKSLQLEGGGVCAPTNVGGGVEGECNGAMNPSVHPWGGLMASRDGVLSLMDCYLYGKSLWVLQSVFDSARARERERELLYPDACGGGGRGWISHGTANYGRIARETCALHTARLSCDTLVDFWSALGDETHLSLLRMKEEDFIERLMYRFDSKRFCRDCRKNVIREFKELKELKRMRREPRCTAWFCAADTAFQYEVSKNKVHAEWHQCFDYSAGAYHHFEWAIGSGEGKTDILAFENVGKTRNAHADELELDALDACYITLRACRLDGRCSELTVKAHALKGKSCVHRRLIVGDGFVTITKGESIRSFFDHAEEAEEEEDDDIIDKDGNELDGDGSRPQKHAKSPELAREFLLDAATVIFKGQVEKAFREGTARQNAHSLFVCLALKLLEERLHVACKEIITLEKQVKLLEEEEKEKREEEERRERRRAKEREKKLRRKERLRGKEREREMKDVESDTFSPSGILEVVPAIPQDEAPGILDEGGPGCEVGEPMIATSTSRETPTDQILHGFPDTRTPKSNTHIIDVEFHDREINDSFILEQSRSSRRRLRFHHDPFQERVFEWSAKVRSVEDGDNNVRAGVSESKSNGCNDASSRCTNSGHRFSRENVVKTSARNPTSRFNEKLIVHSSKNRTHGRNDYHSCNCKQPSGYRGKDIQFAPIVRSSLGVKAINTVDTSFRASHHNDRQSHMICTIEASLVSKEKQVSSRSNTSRDLLYRKQVWEPTDSRKKKQGEEVATTISVMAIDSLNNNEKDVQNECEDPCNLRTPDESCLSVESVEPANANDCTGETNSLKAEGILRCCPDAFDLVTEPCFSKADEDDVGSFSASSTPTLNNGCDSMTSSSSSDNCSPCISEADCSTSSSSARNAESSSTSDSEDVNQQFDGREMPVCTNNEFCTFQDTKKKDKGDSFSGSAAADLKFDRFSGSKISRDDPLAESPKDNNTHVGYEVPQRQQQMLPTPNNGIHSAYLPTMGYHNQHPTSWAAAPNSEILSFSQPHHYLFPSSFGYSIPACLPPDFYLRYNGLHPLMNSVLQVSQAPLFQNVSKMSTLNFNRKTENITGAGSHVNVSVNKPSFMPAPDRSPHEKQSRKESHNTGNQDELHDDISSFSLFHFNGPVAVASGNGVDSTPSKNKTVLDAGLNQNFPEKETVVEEYSLFASGSGSRFLFF